MATERHETRSSLARPTVALLMLLIVLLALLFTMHFMEIERLGS